MKIAILDDWFDTLRTLQCFEKLNQFVVDNNHELVIFNDHVDGIDQLAKRLESVDVLVLIRERTPIRAALIERLTTVKLISMRSAYPHIDVAALTSKRILLCSNLHQRLLLFVV